MNTRPNAILSFLGLLLACALAPVRAATPVMVQDLRRYWAHHRNPLLLFPCTGRGHGTPEIVAARMGVAAGPMPINSLQRLLVEARTRFNEFDTQGGKTLVPARIP